MNAWRIECQHCRFPSRVRAPTVKEAVDKLIRTQHFALVANPDTGNKMLICRQCRDMAVSEAENARRALKAWQSLSWLERLGWTLLVALGPARDRAGEQEVI